jgi:hypothetical protein
MVKPMKFCLVAGCPDAVATSISDDPIPPTRRFGFRELNVIPF